MYERRDPGAIPPAIEEIQVFAQETGLRYVRDGQDGYTRRRFGKGFVFFDQQKRITDAKTVQRIKALVIPPAWRDVWICKHGNGHLQATGRDARGRKQYRYHAKWNEARNETKFAKLLQFGEALPQIRARVETDLKRPDFCKEKVVAAVVKLMELTRIRIGNDVYAQENDSYGLTTILNEHAKVKGHKVQFKFKGKSGVAHEVQLTDARLSRIVQRCQDLPGEELFAYEDEEGGAHDITSGDVNDYLKEITGLPVTAKDFRTWHGTVHAVRELAALGPREGQLSARAEKVRLCGVIKKVAGHLRNTVAICRKYYIHPAIIAADADGFLHRCYRKRKGSAEAVTLEILKR
jgi:DNA topoisomerase-1